MIRVFDSNLLLAQTWAPVLAAAVFVPLFVFLFLTRWPKPRVVHPRRACGFRPDLVPELIDTVVIGSGSGGCTCANLLAQSGQRVLLLERHEKTGGCTHSFREKGCEWDTGLHYTSRAMSKKTARPGAIMDFMSRGTQNWKALEDPYDEIVFPLDADVRPGRPNENSYRFLSGKVHTVDSILNSIDPGDELLRSRARTYLDLCEEINGGFVALGVARILPSWLSRILVGKRVDRLMTLAAMSVRDVQHAILALGYTPQDLLETGCPTAPEGPDPDPSIRRLKAVLTHPIGDYAVQPRDATFAAHGVTMTHYMGGASYTQGATQNISVKNSSLLREFGGEVFVDAYVHSIIVEGGRAVGVRVSNTKALAECTSEAEKAPVALTEIRARNIVCATSIYNMYNKLLPQDLAVVKDFQDPEKRTVRQSNGHVFLFCKIKGDATDLGLPTHNLWYFNGYDLDGAFDEYFANPSDVRPPTVYIGFPCTKDKTWKKRFPGVSNAIMISDGLYEWFERWADKPCRHRGEDYLEFKDKLSRHLLDILYEFVPETRGKVEYHHLGTPLSEITYLTSFRAGSYGTKCQTNMFDEVNRKWTTTPHTAIPGLYLAGSDAFLPSVVGAMYGGCLGASAVLGHVGTIRLGYALLNHLAKGLREDDPSLSWLQSFRMAVDKFLNT